MELIKISTYLSIIGAISVAFGYSTPANLLWLMSNPILIIHNHRNGELAQARMFGVFGCIALVGVVRVAWGWL